MIKLWKLALGVAICAAALNAQTGLGTITGTVGDPAAPRSPTPLYRSAILKLDSSTR